MRKITLELTELEAIQLQDAAGQMRDDQHDWNRSVAPNARAAAAWTQAYHRAMRKLSREVEREYL